MTNQRCEDDGDGDVDDADEHGWDAPDTELGELVESTVSLGLTEIEDAS